MVSNGPANRGRVTQALKSAVQTRGDVVATIDGTRQRTWREVGDRVARAGSLLRALGVSGDDRVAVLALNNDRYLELLFSATWAGGVVVPLNIRWATAEIEEALRECQASMLAVDDNFVAVGRALAARLPGIKILYIGEGEAPRGFVGYEAGLNDHAPGEDCSGAGDDLWAIFFTGGTTRRPKGVMLSHENICFGSLSWIVSMGFTPETKFLHVVSLFHIAGAEPAIALTMAGGTHVLAPKFEPVSAMAAIAEYKVNYTLLIPTMVTMLLHHPDFGKYDLSSMRTCEYGGAPMPDALQALALEKLPTWTFIQGYGQTECTGMMTFLPWERHFGEGVANKRRATGRPGFGIEMRVVDASDNEVPRGVVGEVVTRGPAVMLGYWDDPEATNAVIRNGWLHTGDAGSIDEDGYLTIVDRLKDMIITGGENVYSKEIENAVYKHPSVRDCAILGVPDPKWGERVHAIVVLKAGCEATADSIVEHCRTLIGAYKCPRSVDFRTELPISATGKIMKAALREEFWAGRQKRVI
jgi:long-chain acyl-CoA synthetase